MKKIAILLSGCGFKDGSEIQEAVLSILAIEQKNWEPVFIAPNTLQYEVIDHLTNTSLDQRRNVFDESARITRGKVQNLSELREDFFETIDALWMPGGFGVAKNLSSWAFDKEKGGILEEIKSLIVSFIGHQKPIVALCISPVLIAKSLEDTPRSCALNVGGDAETENALLTLNVAISPLNEKKIAIDHENKIISVPCYMQEVGIVQIFEQTQAAADFLEKWI